MTSSTQINILSVIIFLSIFLLCFCASLPEITQMQTYSSTYQFSHQISFPHGDGTPATNEMAFWWTANSSSNILSFALVSSSIGYLAVGFNRQTDIEMAGVAVLGSSSGPLGPVSLYSILPERGVAPIDSSALIYSAFKNIGSLLFMEVIWDLNKPNAAFNFSVKDPITILCAASTSPVISQWHDYRRTGYVNFDLVNGKNAIKFDACDCIEENQISNPLSTIYGCPCSCVGYYMPPKCKDSNLTWSQTLEDINGRPIINIRWLISGDTVHFDVQAQAITKWAAIGFAADAAGNMIGTDAVVFGMGVGGSETPGISARKIISDSVPGIIIKGALNISSQSLWRLNSSGYGMHFSRKLQDGMNPLGDGDTVYIVSVMNSLTEFPDIHNFHTPGAYTVNLRTGGVQGPVFVWTIKATHGVLMYVSWGIIFPFGYIWARYAKSLPNAAWFEGHRILMTIGFMSAIFGACIAFGMTNGKHFNTQWHSQIGMVALSSMLFQVSSGILRPHLDQKQPKTFRRIVFEFAHHLIGRIGILSAWVTIYGGLLILPNIPTILQYIHAALMALWLVVATFLELRKRMKTQRENYELVNNPTHLKD